MLNGVLIIRKEQGYTSNDVVAKMRGICRQKKIGHTGTLDPNATGVLPVCLGNATKLCDMLTDRSKEYIAQLMLGITTDTQDIWGEVVTDSGEKWRELSEGEIEETVASFQGKGQQIPPMYSALKVNGKRLYELARAGTVIERKAREIEIEEIELLPPEGCPETMAHRAVCFSALPTLRIRVVCSKGTYIRTICQDIGEKLGCGAAMSSLVRTRVGSFRLEEAHTLSEIEEIRDSGGLESVLIPVDACFGEYPAVRVEEEAVRFVKNGNQLQLSMAEIAGDEEKSFDLMPEGSPIRIYDNDGTFYGVYLLQKQRQILKPWKMFLPV